MLDVEAKVRVQMVEDFGIRVNVSEKYVDHKVSCRIFKHEQESTTQARSCREKEEYIVV
jgi:hypothetical protein